MKIVKVVFLVLILTLMCGVSSVSFAATKYHSFVDEMVDNPLAFEENPNDKFINEKRELNQLILDGNEREYISKHNKLTDRLNKEYGDGDLLYIDFDEAHAALRANIILTERNLENKFPYNISGYDKNSLKIKLKDENADTIINDNFKHVKILGRYPVELHFKINKKIVNACKNILGEFDALTLKNTMNLVQDYSILGDSKIALAIARDILPKIEKTFGKLSKETVDVLTLMANDYKILGNYRESEKSLLQAIEINKELYGEENSVELLNNFIELIKLRKATPYSDPELFRSLEKSAKNIDEDVLYCFGYFSTWFLNDTNNYEDINQLYQNLDKESKIFVKYSNPLFYLKMCTDRYLYFSKIAKSIGLYADALNFDLSTIVNGKFSFGNYHYRTLMGICNLSDDYLNLNQSEDALFLSQEALKTSKKIYGDEHPCTVYAIHSLTNVYRQMGRYAEALELDQQAFKIAKKIFTKSSTGEPLENLKIIEDIANDYKGLKNYDSAIEYAENLLNQYMPNKAHKFRAMEARKNLACLYNLNNMYEKTLALYDFLKRMDGTYSLDQLPESILTCQIGFILGDALNSIGKSEAAAKLYFQAIQGYEKARFYNIHFVSEDRRIFFANIVPEYKKTASLLTTQNDFMRAFQITEFCKSRALVEDYSELTAMYNGGLSEEDFSKLTEYQEALFKCRDILEKKANVNDSNLQINLRFHQQCLSSMYTYYKRQFQEKYPLYRELMNNNLSLDNNVYIGRSFVFDENLINIKQMKEILPPNHCYITFLIVKKDIVPNRTSNEILVCLVNDEGVVKGFKIEVDDKFFDKCNFYHELLAYSTEENRYLWKLPDGNYQFTETRNMPAPNAVFIQKDSQEFRKVIQQFSAELGEKLLAPLKDYIADKTNWIISPDGELNNIPFETLQFKGKMAVESADICYVPSFAVLKLMQDMKAKNDLIADRKEIFAMGSADYGDYGSTEIRASTSKFFDALHKNQNSNVDLTQLKWKTLTKAKDELQKVSELFPADRQEIIMGINASEKNLKQRDKDGQLAQYKYILFSTHGIFIQEKPELTSIVLSQGLNDENYDGYVTVGELFGYKLNSDLVHLSACESGLGGYQSGEGIVGLPYALTIAGNKDTVMSLWKINDQIAMEFTSTFFRKIKEGRTEVQALNESKREFLLSPNPQFNNPAAWSAFLLYGI